jgi:hypothetical protein
MSDVMERLEDEDVLCTEVYGREYVAVIWQNNEHGIIANLRFGGGCHKTLVDPDVEKILTRDSVEAANVVTVNGATEVSL